MPVRDRQSVRVHGPALRFVRESRQRSIRSLAAEVGVSQPFITMVELGRRGRVRPQVFAALVSALQVDPAVLRAHPETTVSAPAA